MADQGSVFAGSVPELYDRFMGPIFFAPFADDMARRCAGIAGPMLEIAAGTGILTERLAALPSIALTATDLAQPMLDRARAKPALAGVVFRQADAQTLPFADASFGAVVCQFGVMFFPDRVLAYREALRVRAPGGRFLFNVWEGLPASPIPNAVMAAVAARFPRPEPWFMDRIPHGYHDPAAIRRDLQAAGWADCRIEPVELTGQVASARDAAVALCQGTPMRGELDALGPGALEAATAAAEAEVAARFGAGAVTAPMRALVVEATR